MERLERLDRRAFLRGMMVTSAGLLVPKPATIFVPPLECQFDGYVLRFESYRFLISELEAIAERIDEWSDLKS